MKFGTVDDCENILGNQTFFPKVFTNTLTLKLIT